MTRTLKTTCCIVGGGPAGMMLGVLMARAGVDAVVLEKHADFLRDFRGDTIHPSTLELMHELDVLDEFLKLPHQRAYHLNARFGQRSLRIADFSHLPTRCGYIAFMPQWDFLEFLAGQGSRYDSFTLHAETEVTGLIEDGDRVQGVRARTPEGDLVVRADLVVGADGRSSTVRAASGLQVQELGAPMDVLWFRLSKQDGDPDESTGGFGAGRILIMISRRDHWQMGYVIPKGTLDALRDEGLDAFRAGIVDAAEFVSGRVLEIETWDDVKLLTVAVDRLQQWHRPGLLCIGDAAHAMSPIGGVGVNLAIQDAVASANLLATALREDRLTDSDLAAVQARRSWPTRVTQGLQLAVQKRVITPVLVKSGTLAPPLGIRLLSRMPLLQRIPARIVGLGARPEHILHPPHE